MPRPKRPAHLRYEKDSFSGPAYVLLAAKIASGYPLNEFSPWLIDAVKEKLEREHPDLINHASEMLQKKGGVLQVAEAAAEYTRLRAEMAKPGAQFVLGKVKS
jgi:hypothetical protein